MKKIRIGNDIDISWSIYSNSKGNITPYLLDGKDLKLFIENTMGAKKSVPFNVNGNVVSFTFYGKDQRKTGVYKLILVENDDKKGMRTLDKCSAFHLVDCSCKANDVVEDGNLQFSTLNFSSSIEIGSTTGSNIDLSYYVSVLQQIFTEEQKLQARTNIGAASVEHVDQLFNELKEMIQGGSSVVLPFAVLDEAILDNVVLG